MKRDAAGRSLDRLVFGSIIVGVAAGLYAGWLAAIGAVVAYVAALFVGTQLWLIFHARRFIQRSAAETMRDIEHREHSEPGRK